MASDVIVTNVRPAWRSDLFAVYLAAGCHPLWFWLADFLTVRSQPLPKHDDMRILAISHPSRPHTSWADDRCYLLDLGSGRDYHIGSMAWLFKMYALRNVLFDRVYGVCPTAAADDAAQHRCHIWRGGLTSQKGIEH